ncbi:MAG: glycoside hydrolase family 20 zincin-like fold domain-containing protein [Bacteroidota bacterium]|nr:glycoside hydrolase family 20 zincin-like fold domain-containing protein [Bacteroidota bacterium]
MKILASVILSFSFLLAGSKDRTMSSIIPTPQSIEENNTEFKITSATKIVLGGKSAELAFIAQLINDELKERKETLLKIVPEQSIRKLTGNFIFLGSPASEYGKELRQSRKAKLTPAMKAEGYFLDVDANGIVILAESEKGLLYGCMSLLQLFNNGRRSITINGGTMHDFPSEKMRGITDDISRGQISTLENFKKIIRFCARYKMNVYSPYIEDVFQFARHSDIGKNRGAMTQREWKELDMYAKKYFVELIPIFETFGHWENILLDPQYVGYGEFPGAHTLNVSDEKVYTLLDEMIGEISSSFSSPYFNIGADESWDVGLGANKERVTKSDLATVHAEHYKRVFGIVKKYGKKPMMYGDVILHHPDILKKIPNDVLIVDWHYNAAMEYPSPEVFKSANFSYVVSPAVWNFGGPFPNYNTTFLNIKNLNNDGIQNGSLGMLCSNWNDYGGEALRELNYYGYAWAAECAWNPAAVNQVSFDQNFFSDFFGKTETERVQAVYAMLSSPANQYHWYDLWRHPMLPEREPTNREVRIPMIQRMQSIKSTMPLVLQLVSEAKEDVRQNADHLQYLSFVAKLNLWFAKKIETQQIIVTLLQHSDTTHVDAATASHIVALCKDVADELTMVKSEFQKVWMTTNKFESIDLLLQRYDRQAMYWNEIAEKILRGDRATDPRIVSRWIYHPNAHPNMDDSVQVAKAYFRKTFCVSRNIRSAKLQLIGDTWSKVFVNGKFIGEVYARRSLSLLVENERCKIFDILPHLTDSINTIAVESQNFQENGSAGVNVYCEVISSSGEMQTVISDSSWKVTDLGFNGWNAAVFNDSTWQSAQTKVFPVPIIQPNLATGRTSWFER